MKKLKLIFLLSIFLLLFGCNPNNGGNNQDKRVPIYQGMVLSTEEELAQMSLNKVINQDDPFGNVSGEKIEDEINRKYEFFDDFKLDYYSKVNQKLFLTVKLSNPSSFEILSFTLNGIKYQSYQFEKGSNSENLILEVSSGNNPGVVEFTIDEVKYVDGTEINDVVLEGTRSIKLGVTYSEKPVVVVSDLEVDATSIKFNTEIGDKNGLIAAAGDFLKAVLYDGEDIIQELDLTLGKNVIEFKNLVAGNLYQYAIIAKYNLLDEKGLKINVLDKFALNTEKIFEISSIDSTKDSITFTLNIKDTDILGSIKTIELLENNEVVKTLESFDALSFFELKSNTDYEVIITYEYMALEELIEVKEKASIKTKEKEVPTLNIKEVVPAQESVEFVVEIIDNDLTGAIKSIELWQGNTFVQKLEDLKLRAFSNLYSNNSYTIIIKYEYDLNDGNGVKSLEVKETFLTLKKTAPYVKINDENIKHEEYEGTVELVKHSDYDAEIQKIELYHNDELIDELDSKINLKDLLAGNSYKIKVTYTYDLNDNLGLKEDEYEYEFTTLAYKTPDLTLELEDSKEDFILLKANITDEDEVGSITSAVSLKDGKLFNSLDSFDKLLFTGLYADIKYTFKITYSYDLRDGNGIKTLVKTLDAYTAPSITVLSTKVINTEKLTEGDYIAFEISVFNPQKMTFTRVMINDEYYPVSDVTTNDKIRVEFTIGPEYRGGTTKFVVQKIEGKNYNQERSFDIEENNEGYAFVNGDIFVDSLQILDKNGQDLEYAMPGDSYKIKIIFDNPTGYVIDTLNISYLGELKLNEDFELSEDNSVVTINITNTVSNTTYNYNLYSFTYLVDEASKQKNVENISDIIVLVKSTVYKYIYTPSDLANLESGYSYKLANDIDLADYDWKPKDISYVIIDGNGYTIKNLRNIKTYVDTSVVYGLFRYVSSSILNNISIDDLLFMISITNSTTQSEYSADVGGLAVSIYNSSLKNININGEISVNNNTSLDARVGGVAYSISTSVVEDTYVDMIISSTGNMYNGIVTGYLYNTKINKIIVEGSLFSKYHSGSVAGNANSSIISNLVVNTNLYTNYSYYVGGIIGYGNGLIIENGYVLINLNGSEYWGVGYLGGYLLNSKIANLFAITSKSNYQLIGEQNELIKENLNTYKDIASVDLGNYEAVLDNNIWNFEGELPTLKWNPLIKIIDVNIDTTSISFDLKEIDFNNIGEVEKIELIDSKGKIVATIEGTIREFNNIKYNTEYEIKVTYKFNYQDGSGDQYLVEYFSVRTLPNEGSPKIDIIDIGITSDSISFDLEIEDPDDYGDIEKIELFDLDNNLIASLEDFTSLQFTKLESNTTYRIVVTYSFDIDDSYGIQYIEVRKVVKTNPSFALKDVIILNTDALMVGDILVLQIVIENPDGITFNKITINGNVVNVKTQFNDYLIADLKLTEELGVGSVDVIIEKLMGTFNNAELVYSFTEATENNQVNIFVNGDIYITNMRFVDAKGKELEYALANQEYYLEIEFYNPTKYLIYKVDMINNHIYNLDTHYTISNNNSIIRIKFVNNNGTYPRECSIVSFNYSSTELGIDKEKKVSNTSKYINIVNSDNVNYIYTIDDLKNMQNGYSYKLMNNLDFTGVSWQPREFTGIFDGNGYAISNLSIVRNFQNQSTYIGLFSMLYNSIVKNLTLHNFNFILNANNDSTYSYYNDSGALAAQISHSNISNIIINANISVNSNTGYDYKALGGLAGRISNINIDRVYVEGTYFINGSSYFGGLVGKVDSSKVSNITSNVNIKNSSGTIIGYLDNTLLENSYSYGISENGNSLVKYSYNSFVKNSFSITKNLNGNYLEFINSSNFENVYSPTYASKGQVLSYENIIQIMRKSWDDNIWSFESNQPILKFIPKLELIVEDITIDTIRFDILINDYFKLGKLIGIKLYEDGVFKAELSNLSIREFADLRYSTNYQIKLVYEYSYGEDKVLLEKVFEVRTEDKDGVPAIEFENVKSSKEEITFDLKITDDLEIGSITKINLYDINKNLIQSLTDYTNLKFEDLYSDYEYILEVIYTYDFDDGYESNYVSDIYVIKTKEKSLPIVDLSVNSNVDEVLYSIKVTDKDNTIIKYKVVLLDKNGKELDNQLDTVSGKFVELEEYTNYIVQVIYEYDLNNSVGNVENVITRNIKTSPFIAITDISVLNTEALIVGDDLVLTIGINNPSNIVLSKVKINGKYYDVSNQTNNSIRVTIELDSTFEGGDTLIEIEELIGTINNELFNINIDAYNSIEIFINGDIYITNVEIVNQDYEPIEYIKGYTNYYLKVTFYNPTNYSIDSLNITSNYSDNLNIIHQESNIVYVSFRSSYYYPDTYISLKNTIKSFSYSNENISRTKAVGYGTLFMTIVEDDTIKEISSAEELQNIKSGNAYKLANDIDLEGITFNPISNFKGYFDGNGYTIKNLSIIKTDYDENSYIGLFERVYNSVIKNVTLENINYIISLKSNSNSKFAANIGGLIGYSSEYTKVYNNYITGEISLDNQANNYSYIGGLIGSANYTNLYNNSVEVSLSSNNNIGNTYIGGLIGESNDSFLENTMVNVVINNKGNFNTYIGGLVSTAYNTIVSNSYVVGQTNVDRSYGFIRYLGSNTNIMNSYSIVLFNSNYRLNIESNSSTATVKNLYSLVYDGYSTVLTLPEIHERISELWDHDIWDFENVDEQGNPTLKR